MKFWIYMTFMGIIVPLVLLAVGLYYTKCPPEKIYTDFGYKTPLTLKNEDIWAYAHQLCGKSWIKLALIMIPASIAVMVIPLFISEDAMSFFSVGLFVVQCVAVFFSFRKVKATLLTVFDEEGNRRNAVPAEETPAE
jgi:hypothetical protein